MIETKIDHFISDSLEPDVKNEIMFQCNIGNYSTAIEKLYDLLKESLDDFIYNLIFL